VASLKDRSWLFSTYVLRQRTLTEIGQLVGVSPQTVGRAMTRFNIDRRRPARRWASPRLTDERWLRYRYEQQGLTTVQIAQELGVAARTVNDALRRLGIARRPPRHHRPRESADT
jgi:transposase